MKRNRDRVTEAFALGEAGRARVSRALAGEEEVGGLGHQAARVEAGEAWPSTLRDNLTLLLTVK